MPQRARLALALVASALLVAPTLPPLIYGAWYALVPRPEPAPAPPHLLAPGLETEVNFVLGPPRVETVVLEGGVTVELSVRGLVLDLGLGDARVVGLLFRRVNATSGMPGVLLLHGLGGSSASVAEHARLLAAQGFTVLALDLPGHGGSGLAFHASASEALRDPDPERNLLRQVYVAALRAATVLSRLSGDYVIAVGGSLGGLAAMVAACLHPDVRAAVAIAASGCLGCGLAEASLAAAVAGPAAARVAAVLDPLSFSYACARGRVLVVTMPSHDAFFSPSGLARTVSELRDLGWRVVTVYEANAVHEPPPPRRVASYVVLAYRALEQPLLVDTEAVAPRVEAAPLVVTVSGDRAAYRLWVGGAPFSVSQPPQPLVPLAPLEVVGYANGYGVELSTLPRRVGVAEAAAVAGAGLLTAALAARGLARSEDAAVGARRATAAALLALAAPSLAYCAPGLYWPGVAVAPAAQVVERWLTPLNAVAVAALLAAPVVAAAAVALYPRRRLAAALLAAYAASAATPVVVARLYLVWAGLGPGVPPLSPLILAPTEFLPAAAALALHRWLVTPAAVAAEARRRRRRRARARR